MKKIIAVGIVSLCIGMATVQASEINIVQEEEQVCYGLIPNPFKVATKIITAPARAVKKQVETARKVAKIGKKIGDAAGGDTDEDKRNGNHGDRADIVEKNKKKNDKQFEQWKQNRDQELEQIAKEKEERERLRKELGMEASVAQEKPEKGKETAVSRTAPAADKAAEDSATVRPEAEVQVTARPEAKPQLPAEGHAENKKN